MGHDQHEHHGTHSPGWAGRIERLNDVGRLKDNLSEADLADALALRGDEDILDLGSGTGFYTDRIAALTSGTVYALEILPEMLAHYRARGIPHNVRLVQGDMTSLSENSSPLPVASATASIADAGAPTPGILGPACVDVAVTIATWHEISGRLDVEGVAQMLRPGGRLAVFDWRREPSTWEHGPPQDVRYSTDEVTSSLASHFTVLRVDDIGDSMFALVARRS